MDASALLAQIQPHELVGLDTERPGDRHQGLEGRAQLSALDPTDVVAVEPRLEAEPLLRVPALQAQPAQGGTERGKVALGRGEGFRHAQGRSQAARSQSTSFTVSSYRGAPVSYVRPGPTSARPLFLLAPGHLDCTASSSLASVATRARSLRARRNAAGDPLDPGGHSRFVGGWVIRGVTTFTSAHAFQLTLDPPVEASQRPRRHRMHPGGRQGRAHHETPHPGPTWEKEFA